jgi:hypothetical protein
MRSGRKKRLVILAKEVSDAVIGLLVNNNRAKTIGRLLYVRLASSIRIGWNHGRSGCYDRGRVFHAASKDGLADFQIEDLAGLPGASGQRTAYSVSMAAKETLARCAGKLRTCAA